MAGTVDISYQEFRSVKRVIFDWLADASGDVSGTESKVVNGVLLKAVFIPDSGDLAPDASYDVILEDDNGLDVLSGQGADLSALTATSVIPGVPLDDGTTTSVGPQTLDDKLELQVSNAGTANAGQLILYMR